MRAEAGDAADRLVAQAVALSAVRSALARTAGPTTGAAERELVAQVDARLEGANKALSRAAAAVRRGVVNPVAADGAVADASAAAAYGQATVVGGTGAASLARWLDLIDRALAAAQAVAPPSDQAPGPPLEASAADYLLDAGLDARSSAYWSAAVLFLTVSAGAVAVLGLVRVTADGQFGLLGAHLAVAGVLLLASVPPWWQAERHRRASADGRRLARQVAQLSAFLAPFPPEAATVMRAGIAQRLFSRPPGDDDPLREPLWPVPADLFPPGPAEPWPGPSRLQRLVARLLRRGPGSGPGTG